MNKRKRAAPASAKTAAQLQAMRNNLAGIYCLANDIDAGTIVNFKPIGTAANRFTGRLLGNIRAPRIVIIEGAVFKGMSDMSGRKDEHKEKAAAS